MIGYRPNSGKTDNDCFNNADVERAVREVLKVQIDLGLDVITDGEINRENYVSHFCKQLRGINHDNLQLKTMRDGILFIL